MKTFPCPYCGQKFNKNKMVPHIDKNHDDELPVGYTAYRATYDLINDKHGHGVCTVCGKDTKWNDKTQKYNRLCGDPKCAQKVKETYQKRMMKVYNKVHLLDDPMQQEKMLAGRRISGKYKWRDGKEFDYVGSFEHDLLEFLDQTMEFDSGEIVSPGPVLEYEYEGKKRHWITDFLILPYNLIIEVKDGGDNPNRRNMPIYRGKQYAKEKMITNMGTYNYLRLTNNNFAQLFSILAELKKQVVEQDTTPIYRIHEEDESLSYESMAVTLESISYTIDKVIEPTVCTTSTHTYKEDVDGENYFEMYKISSPLKNSSAIPLFEHAVNELYRDVSKIVDPDLIHFAPINESNPLDGYSLGIYTRTLE